MKLHLAMVLAGLGAASALLLPLGCSGGSADPGGPVELGVARAAITQPTAWTQAYAGTAYPSGKLITLTPGTGEGRLLLVAIASRTSTGAAQTVSVSYGGRALSLAQGDGGATTPQHTYFYYLLEADLAGVGASDLSATITGGTAAYTWVYAAVFAGVDQATPFTDRQGFTTWTAMIPSVGPFSDPLALSAFDWPIEVILLQRYVPGSAPRSISTWATGWGTNGGSLPVDKVYDDGSTFPHLYIAHRAVPTAATTDDSEHGTDGMPLSSMSGLSLNSGQVVTLGDGIAGTGGTVCPGTAGRKLDGFSLVSNTGSASVTALTVTTTGYTALRSASVWDEAGTTQYFETLTSPSSDTLSFSGGTAIPVTTTAQNFKLLVTYDDQTQLPPGGTTSTTARVTALTAGSETAGSDGADTTVLLDHLAPTGASWDLVGAGDRQVSLSWTYGAAGDSALIVRYQLATSGTMPTDGTAYTAGEPFGNGGTIVYVGDDTSFTDTGLTNGSGYTYQLFEFDPCLNYVASDADAPTTTVTPRPVILLGEGVAATSAAVCPGASSQKLDGFSLAASQGTATVTGLSVGVSGFAAIQTLAIADEAGTRYFAQVTPSSGTVIFNGGTIPLTTTPTNFKVLATYRSALSGPQGVVPTTAWVVYAVSTNPQSGTDAAEATLTYANQAPSPGASWDACTAGDKQVELSWTPGTAGNGAMVVRYLVPSDTTLPEDGRTYSAGASFGKSGSIVYVGTATSFTDTGVLDGMAYYYRLFEFDGCLNYVDSDATAPWVGPLRPNPTVTLGEGVAAADGIACPGTADRKLDGFSLVTSQGNGSVTGLTVTVTGAAALQSVAIFNEAGTTQYFTTLTAPGMGTLSFSGGTPLPVSATRANFQVRATFRSEAQSPPAGKTDVTAAVTALSFSSSALFNVAGSDGAEATVTLDNQPPAASWGINSVGDRSATLNWSTDPAGEYALLVRYASSSSSAAPVDGTSYAAGETLGAGTVVYAGSASTFTDTGLSNGTATYYRAFAYDGCGNYEAAGPWSAALTPTAVLATLGDGIPGSDATVCPGETGRKLDGFSLVNSQGTTPVTALTVELTGPEAIESASVWDEAGTVQYFLTISEPISGTLHFVGGTPLPVSTVPANFKIVVAYRSEAQSPPVGPTATTARVTAIATAIGSAGSDSADTTLTLDRACGADGGTRPDAAKPGRDAAQPREDAGQEGEDAAEIAAPDAASRSDAAAFGDVGVAPTADGGVDGEEGPADPYSLIGCGCGAASGSSAPLGLLALLGLWASRRRKEGSARC